MQIDFHHAVTYVLSRLAGCPHADATIIAYAAQYVDDATNKGTLRFDNGATYEHIASAHVTFDVAHHLDNSEDYQVWVPFHFLPGNNGNPAGQGGAEPLIRRLICTPDSHVSNDMWRACRQTKGTPNGLHRLGITAHVYADTFAHQMFAGIRHDVNDVTQLKDISPNCPDVGERFAGALNALKLGHGSALTRPDQPFLTWKYRNGYGQEQARDNAELFVLAAKRLFSQFIYYLDKDPTLEIQPKDLEIIGDTFRINASPDENYRHQQWHTILSRGGLSFGKLTEEELTTLSYVPKGEGSWKWAALGTTSDKDSGDEVFHYEQKFLDSHWRKFHEALKSHQHDLLERIFPQYDLPSSFAAAAGELG